MPQIRDRDRPSIEMILGTALGPETKYNTKITACFLKTTNLLNHITSS